VTPGFHLAVLLCCCEMFHRGRDFRGGAPLKGEDGAPLAPAGPPQLFPVRTRALVRSVAALTHVPQPAPYLPVLPVLSKEDEELLMRKRMLEKAYQSSPYFLTLPTKKKGEPRRRCWLRRYALTRARRHKRGGCGTI
jgi:hypothetical protein